MLSCLQALAGIYGDVADEAKLNKALARPGDTEQAALSRALKTIGLRGKVWQGTESSVNELHVPAIALLSGVPSLILQNGRQELLVIDPVARSNRVLSHAAFFAAWSGWAVQVSEPYHWRRFAREFHLRWFGTAFSRFRLLLGEVLLMAFLLQCFGVVMPLFTQVIVDKVLPHRGVATLDILVGLIFISYVFQALVGFLRTYILTHTTNKLDTIFGARIFRKVCSLPLRYFETRRAGDTVTRVREMEHVREFLTGSSLTLLLDTLFSLVFFLVMAYYSLVLALAALLAVPVFVGTALYFGPRIQSQLRQKFLAYRENYTFLVESLTGIQTVKSLAMEPRFNRQWEESIGRYVQLSFASGNIANLYSSISRLTMLLFNLLILWGGSRLVIAGEMSIGGLIAFNMLAGQAMGSVTHVAGLWQSFQQTRLSMAMLGDILNAPSESGPAQPSIAAERRLDLRLEQVSFRYLPKGPLVLDSVSIDVFAGQSVGIVGRSGSGKSTLAKLLQCLYRPESGVIRIGGEDVTQVDPAWLRRQIGVVLQENYLFSGTIRDNIAIANPGASLEEVLRAAKLAGAHEFIAGLPEGYDTPVSEAGNSLSGGQKQRIAIARVLMLNPPVLVFDEATSYLDYESERVVMQNMAQISAGRSLILIAHRLSTVRSCDRIIVMDKGRVVETGTHTELMAVQGLYHWLYRQQSSAGIAGKEERR
jgi:subfamily B ATP-binding cassette protein HlyB/CyaB